MVAYVLAFALFGAWVESAQAAEVTTVTARADGVLAIHGGTGASGVIIDNHPPGAPSDDTDVSKVYIAAGALFGPAQEQTPEPVVLAAGESWCRQDAAPSAQIICDAASIDRITVDLGDGDDFLLTQGLTHVGDHTSGDPESDPAVDALMGAGDDTYAGGIPLGEQVQDGPGTDYVSTCCDEGGADHILQPDVADPATEDTGDFLDMSYGSGVVDYSARTNGQGVTVTTRDGQANDGAPGEGDKVMAHGVRGTGYDDELVGLGGADFITFAFSGGAGDDELTGGDGSDVLDAGDGNDEVTGGDGVDDIDSGAGDDSIAAADDFDDSLDCGTGTDALVADPIPLDAGNGCEDEERPARPALVLSIDERPPAATDDPTPTVAFSANLAQAIFDCSLDGGVFFACSSPLTPPSALADGPHTLVVRATHGVQSDSETLETTVDTVAPETTIASAPDGPVRGIAQFDWTSDEDGVTYECALDGGAWRACSESLDVSALAVGDHELAVRAVDGATNTDATPARASFTVAGAEPTPTPTPTPTPSSAQAPSRTPTPLPSTPPPVTTPQGGGTNAHPARPKRSAPRFVAPKHGKLQVNRKGRMRLSFRCRAGKGCARQRLVLRAKVGERTYKAKFHVKALKHGKRARVTVKLPRKLVKAVRKRGRRGVRATLKVKGAKPKRIRLTAAR